MTVEPCVTIDLAQLTMNFDRCYTLCIQTLYRRPHFTVGGNWNKSLHLQPLQRSYCENFGSSASAYVMRRHYPTTYTPSLHAINGLLAVGRVRNLLCGFPSYISFETTSQTLKYCEDALRGSRKPYLTDIKIVLM